MDAKSTSNHFKAEIYGDKFTLNGKEAVKFQPPKIDIATLISKSF